MSPVLSTSLLALADVEIPKEQLQTSTNLILLALGLVLAFFVIRPELWRRMLFQRVDARPAALMRIVFGTVVAWTFIDLLKPHGPLDHSVARFLFTDEGLWLTDMARKNYGEHLKTLWDAEHGFEHWYDLFKSMWGRFSILHFRSDPPFVWAVYSAMLASLGLMILGVWTRWTTIIAWFLVEMVYRYSPVYYTGGDTVVRVFLFLGMFAQWGEAYSIDSWRRRRKAILGGAKEIPPLRTIPAWPLRLAMLQLTIIYCATGLLKSGGTWADGTALYFALNLDHFYRWPQMGMVGMMQYLGVLPALTILVHWWEVLFPMALLGAAVNAWERERAAGIWPVAAMWRRALSYLLIAVAWGCGVYVAGMGAQYYIPDDFLAQNLGMSRPAAVNLAMTIAAAIPVVFVSLYFLLRRFLPRVHVFIRHWVLGKRFWLVVGFGMHINIDIGMNVGTFAEVMMAVYFAWLSGEEIDAFWHYVLSRPLNPGEGNRPVRKRKVLRWLLAPGDRLIYRAPGAKLVVLHNPDEASVRRAALLRVWDLGDRLEFEADPDVAPQQLRVRMPGETTTRTGTRAAYSFIRLMPGLWWMRGLRHLWPHGFGWIALKVLRQRA